MLNLSDKELDRFSKEAAQEYEPGDVLGPRSWDRLEVRITQEFGRPGWNPIRHIRRFPFYYAPALLLLLGVAYYLLRPGASSGSSPGGTAKAPTQKIVVQKQNSISKDKATSTPATSSDSTSAAADRQGNEKDATSSTADRQGNGKAAPGAGDGSGDGGTVAGGARSANGAGAKTAAGGAGATGTTPDGLAANDVVRNGRPADGAARNGNAGNRPVSNRSAGGGRRGNTNGRKNAKDAGDAAGDNNTVAVTVPLTPAGAANGTDAKGGPRQSRELSLSAVQRPRSLGRRGAINDSALRALTTKSTAPTLIRKKGVYRINRNWQFGLMIAPDFTSVNSLAGDKAGSSIGLTVDYMFAPHWYLSSGILATRKNYAARDQDYHAPPTFYQSRGIYGNVSFVKGSFYMMEIPLNLRYDFSVAGNTLFFISAGTSSYLMTTENANLYWRHFNMEECNGVDHLNIKPTNLFSTVNLSAGVEAGLSNSLSLLIAPYMKLPTKSLGLGQVQMNSVGIDFVLKFSPVTSRKRQ